MLRTTLVFAAGLATACATPGPSQDHSSKRFQDGAPCRQSLHVVLEQIKRSQTMMCTGDSDCALITNPATAAKEYRVVVHARDAARLDRQAQEQLQKCGAFRPDDPRQGLRGVTAKCVRQRCAEDVTLMEADE